LPIAILPDETDMTDATVLAVAPDGPRFTIGGTLSLGFGVLRHNWKPMTFIAVIVIGIQCVIDYLISGDPTGGETSIGSILGIATYSFITAPITYATFQHLSGNRVGFRDLLVRGFSRVGRVIGASFVIGFAVFLPIALAGYVGVFVGVAIYLIAVAVGLFVLYILVIWFVAIPVQVMEPGRFVDGFWRALDLSRGRRWRILGLGLVYGTLIVVVASSLVIHEAVAPGLSLVGLFLFVAVGAFNQVVGAILPAVGYYLLRAEKEGVGIDDIVKVFE
jgi:hypothetical protein